MNVIKPKTKKPDFRVFLILGISFIPIGIATDLPTLWIIGIVFLTLALVIRKKN